MLHSFRIQITQYIGRPDASLQIRTIHEGKKEIRRTNAVVALPGGPDTAIQRNGAVFAAQILAVPQIEIGKHRLQLVLGDFAGSAFQIGPVG